MRDVVIALARPMLRLLGRDERGAAALIVAILLGGGVLLGMGALVLDVGQIYQNRAELQNGADAGALAVAKSCALGTCDPAIAATDAAGNASALTGHEAGVQLVCGSGTLGACPEPSGSNITNCPANPPSGTNYVDVRTETETPTGAFLPPVFGKAIVGSQNYNGAQVFACAQAEWGPAAATSSLALTISYCDWQSLTSGSQYDVPVAVYLKGDEKACSGPAGQNLPGGFGWLDQSGTSPCTAAIDPTTDTVGSSPGNNVSADCKSALAGDVTDYDNGSPQTVYVPIFSSTSGKGSNGSCTVMGMAAFVVTGYSDLSGAGNAGPKSDGPSNSLCSVNDPCLEGYFTPGIDPVSTTIGSGTNFGATTIELTG
jgi:Flp pilus assembly protein TadG